jgi:hypothetical protein
MVDKEGGASMEDAAGFFAHVFGGDRFVDYVRCPFLDQVFLTNICSRLEKYRL